MCSTPEIPTLTSLCKHHYHLIIIWYNQLRPTVYVTCGTSMKHSSPKVCPQPEAVVKHFRENTDFDGHIYDHDKVCHACCWAQLVILKGDDNETSSDSHLKELLINLSQQILSSVKKALDTSIKIFVCDAGRELMGGSVLHLPAVCDLLYQYVTELFKVNSLETEEINQLFTSGY